MIDKAIYGGFGLGHVFDRVILIPGAIPGETVKAEVTEEKKDYLVGRITGFVKSSSSRINAPCSYYDCCGCCHYQHISYNRQTSIKRDILEETLSRVGGIDNKEINRIIESPDNYGYRSRVELKITRKSKKNDPFLGFYRENSHKIVPVARCLVCNDRINELIEAINFYSPVLLKQNSDSIKILYSKSSDKLLLRVKGKGLYKKTMESVYGELKKYVKGLIGITFGYGNKKTSIGKSSLFETINNIKYRVNSDSFFQINNLLHEELIKIIIDLFAPKKSEYILDLYCGVGTFTLQLAKKSGKIIGVEENEDAVSDAKYNAKKNSLSNTSFISGDTSVLLPKIINDNIKIKSVFLNPPRTGCSTEVKNIISKSNVNKIVYLSCNPSTLARDLNYFIKKRFIPEIIQPIDLFPQTMHVETAVLLKRNSG